MQKTISALLLLALPLVGPAARSAPSNSFQEEKLKVVATIPDLADIARQIGGERVDVRSIARGRENIHAVRILPSHLAAVDRADVFVQMGLSMEHAWVPALLRTAKNPEIAVDTPGFVSVAEGWDPIQVPTSLSREHAADIHPRGNPHFNLHPASGRHIAERIHAALCAKDPGSADYYDARLRDYLEQLAVAEARWAKIRAQLAGKLVVEYHQEFDYLALACGLDIAAILEPKPGVPPSPDHLAGVIKTMQERGISVILTAAWSNNKSVRSVAEKTGAQVLELPDMVDGAKGCETWIAMMDHLHRELARAFGITVED